MNPSPPHFPSDLPSAPEEAAYRFLSSDAGARSRLHYQVDRNRDFDLSALQYARQMMSTPKPSVLDIGSADGYLTADRFGDTSQWGNVYGIERDSELVAECNQKYGTRMTFTCANLETMAEQNIPTHSVIREDAVDLVFCALVMHHIAIEKQQQVMDYLWSFVKPGGCLIVRTNDDSLYLNYPDGEELQRFLAISAQIPVGPERCHARKLFPQLFALTHSKEDIKIMYFMGDSHQMERKERELFFNYAYQFRIPVIERAIKTFPNEEKYVKMLDEAKGVYNKWKKLFPDDGRYYLLAPECIGIAFKGGHND